MAILEYNWGFSRAFRTGSASLVAAGTLAATFSGCMDRPVQPSEPKTSNIFVQAVPSKGVDKIDLLFVVDNSISMSDKQQILKDAVPVLVKRLVQPVCVSGDHEQTTAARLPSGLCPETFSPEFQAINDIHIGVISSSLGDYGSGICEKADNDDAHLIATKRKDVASWNDTGFLAWGPAAGVSDVDQIVAEFSDMIEKTGEAGCGYEATLESWYRFLVDPEPPLKYNIDPATLRAQRDGIDRVVLDQRAKFLRPDSLVAIIMLSDENDCSIEDEPYGHIITTSSQTTTMHPGTSACDKDPNDKCCRWCRTAEAEPPPGCAPLKDDPACKAGVLPAAKDSDNLRCFQQKKRFGYDFLFPIERYVDALTKNEVFTRDGRTVENPLFAGPIPRDRGLVFLAGIVGVPWQDIADDESLKDDRRLRFLNAKELTAAGRWDEILGEPSLGVAPLDPLTIESPAPRSGRNAKLSDRLAKAGRAGQNVAIAPDSSTNPRENVINGHEHKVPMTGTTPNPEELQYACIFERSEPKPCTEKEDDNCDCKPATSTPGVGSSPGDAPRNRPLCQPPTGGAFEATQYFGKAYPGTRHLEVLRGFGENGIVASICPKVSSFADEAAKLDPSYGYNPAVAAIIDQLKQKFDGGCLNRELIVGTDETAADFGKVGCAVVEARRDDAVCSCSGVGRSKAREQLVSAVRAQLSEGGQCAGEACNAFCMCELEQLVSDKGAQCQNAETVSEDTAGYCYIDAKKTDRDGNPTPIGKAEFANGCPSGRKLRFVGEGTPAKGSIVYMACAGQATFN